MNDESVATMVNGRYVWALHGVILVPLLAYQYFHVCLYYLLAAAFVHAFLFLRGVIVEQLGEDTAETLFAWAMKISFVVSLVYAWHVIPSHAGFSIGQFIVKLIGLQIRYWALCFLGICSIPCLPRAFRKLVADAKRLYASWLERSFAASECRIERDSLRGERHAIEMQNRTLAAQLKTQKEQSDREIRTLQATISKEQDLANTEHQKREASDRRQSIVRESCRKLLAFAEDGIRAIEAETLEVLHSGLEVSLIDEEMSKLKYRNGVLSGEVAQLRQVLSSVEEK
jgi:hypothetical protein